MSSQEIKRRILNLNTESGRIKTPMLNSLLILFEREVRYEEKDRCIVELNKMDAESAQRAKRFINV